MDYQRFLLSFKILAILLIVHGENKGRVEGDPVVSALFKCPKDSVCMDWQECRSKSLRHYVTADGKPYYCGTRYHVGEWVCCEVKSESTDAPLVDEETGYSYSTLPPSPSETIIEESAPGGPYSSNSGSNGSFEDNLITNSNLPLPDLPQDRYDENGDHLENHDNVIDFNMALPQLDDLLTDEYGQRLPFKTNEQKPGAQFRSHNNEDSLSFPGQFTGSDALEPYLGQGEIVRESRQSYHPSQCQCGPGERGPKGDPGEPGKVVYVPVFIPSPNVPGTNAAAYSNFDLPPPQQPQAQPPYYNQQPPSYQQSQPQYPNPSSYSFAYPSAPSIQPQSPYQPVEYPYQVPYTQQPYQSPVYTNYQSNPPQPVLPYSIPHNNALSDPYANLGIIPQNYPISAPPPPPPQPQPQPQPPQPQGIYPSNYGGTDIQRFRRQNRW